jgi:NAD(P)-dependent dehydrogenase (short-subunit alcohol dehydrogenase family)
VIDREEDRVRRLDGKTAIVTGGASGIGQATALRLSSEGARVVIADIDRDGGVRVAAAIEDNGGDAIALFMDLNDEASIQAMVADAVNHYGALDILHNNAADMRARYLAEDTAVELMDADLWDGIFRANMRGTMLVTKYALPTLLAAETSAIINTSSGASLRGDLYRPAYGSSKAAVNTFTAYVATQYGKRGVRCNAVSPGIILTAKAEEANTTETMAAFLRHTLSPRIGRPEDIAGVVAMLASDDGRYINGQVIQVDGGIMAHFSHVADIEDGFWNHVGRQREQVGMVPVGSATA